MARYKQLVGYQRPQPQQPTATAATPPTTTAISTTPGTSSMPESGKEKQVSGVASVTEDTAVDANNKDNNTTTHASVAADGNANTDNDDVGKSSNDDDDDDGDNNVNDEKDDIDLKIDDEEMDDDSMIPMEEMVTYLSDDESAMSDHKYKENAFMTMEDEREFILTKCYDLWKDYWETRKKTKDRRLKSLFDNEVDAEVDLKGRMSAIELPQTKRYYILTTRCRNWIHKSIKYVQVHEADIENVKYEVDSNLLFSSVIKSNLYVLSLFTRVSEHDILYSSPVNFRSVINDAFLCNDGKQSMVEQVYKGNPRIFSTNPMYVLVYQEKIFDDIDEPKYEDCYMTSMAKETLIAGCETIKEVKIKYTSVGVVPSSDWVAKIAYILGVKIPTPTPVEKSCGGSDIASILAAFVNVRPKNNNDIANFIKMIKWDSFFQIQDRSFTENMWRIRSFFQVLHPVGVAFVEGNHRAVLAGKVFYGQDVNDSFPLSHDFTVKVKPIPLKSPLLDAMEVKLLMPKGKFMEDRLITGAMLQTCKATSKEVAVNKSYVVPENWKTFLHAMLDALERDNGFVPFEEDAYFRIAMPDTMVQWKSRKLNDPAVVPYESMHLRAIQHVVQCLMHVEPAKKIAMVNRVNESELRTFMTQSSRIGMNAVDYYSRETPDAKNRKKDGLTLRWYQNINMHRNIQMELAAPIYGELISRVALIGDGFASLVEFSKGDVRYMDPMFLATVVLAPVTRIVTIIFEIMDLHNLWTGFVKCKKTRKKNQRKLQKGLRYWYTTRYLRVLTKYQPIQDAGLQKQSVRKHKMALRSFQTLPGNAYESESKRLAQNNLYNYNGVIQQNMGDTPIARLIGGYGLQTVILYNLPREFERWKDKYGDSSAGIAQGFQCWLPPVDFTDWKSDNDSDSDTSWKTEATIDTLDEMVENVEADIVCPIDMDYFTDTENDEKLVENELANRVFLTTDNPCGFTPYVPMDVGLAIHPTIIGLGKQAYDENFTHVQQHKSWDPSYIVDAMMSGAVKFAVSDFYEGQASRKKKSHHADDENDTVQKQPPKKKGKNETGNMVGPTESDDGQGTVTRSNNDEIPEAASKTAGNSTMGIELHEDQDSVTSGEILEFDETEFRKDNLFGPDSPAGPLQVGRRKGRQKDDRTYEENDGITSPTEDEQVPQFNLDDDDMNNAAQNLANMEEIINQRASIVLYTQEERNMRGQHLEQDRVTTWSEHIRLNVQEQHHYCAAAVRVQILLNFDHVFQGRNDEWAKKTLCGLNRIFNFFARDGVPDYNLRMEDLKNSVRPHDEHKRDDNNNETDEGGEK